MNLNGKKIVFLGDSITHGVGVINTKDRYTDIILRECNLREMQNYGINGTRIARQQHINPDAPIDWKAFTERFQNMDDDADVIVVFGGTNDYGHGDAPFGVFEDRTMDTFCGSLHYLMQGLINKYPEAEIVFMTPLHRTGENTPTHEDGKVLKEYVEQIRKTAEYYSLPVVDLFSISGIYPDIQAHREVYCPDGLHPNEKGHLVIASRLKAFLEQL